MHRQCRHYYRCTCYHGEITMTQYGEDHKDAKLTADEVRSMRKLKEDGHSTAHIASLYPRVAYGTVVKALLRITWRRVE